MAFSLKQQRSLASGWRADVSFASPLAQFYHAISAGATCPQVYLDGVRLRLFV
jgi:hypothetical protein